MEEGTERPNALDGATGAPAQSAADFQAEVTRKLDVTHAELRNWAVITNGSVVRLSAVESSVQELNQQSPLNQQQFSSFQQQLTSLQQLLEARLPQVPAQQTAPQQVAAEQVAADDFMEEGETVREVQPPQPRPQQSQQQQPQPQASPPVPARPHQFGNGLVARQAGDGQPGTVQQGLGPSGGGSYAEVAAAHYDNG